MSQKIILNLLGFTFFLSWLKICEKKEVYISYHGTDPPSIQNFASTNVELTIFSLWKMNLYNLRISSSVCRSWKISLTSFFAFQKRKNLNSFFYIKMRGFIPEKSKMQNIWYVILKLNFFSHENPFCPIVSVCSHRAAFFFFFKTLLRIKLWGTKQVKLNIYPWGRDE